ncbi:MAG: ATP-binding protein [Flavobacteriales bacterium]
MRRMLCGLLVLAPAHGYAQDASLIPKDLKRLEVATTDPERVVLLNRICFNYADKDPAKGLGYGQRGLALATRIVSEQGMAEARSRMGYCYIRLSEFARADSISALAVEGFERLGDRCNRALTLMNLGLSREMRHDEAGAVEFFQKALKEGEACSNSAQQAALLYSMGGPYERMGRFPEALHYYTASYALDSARQDSARLAKDHIAIANVHGALNDIDAAMDHYKLSIRCSQAIGDTLVVGYVWYNCAEIEKMRGDATRAVDYGERAVAVFEQLHRRAELLHAEVFLGALYQDAGRASDARHVLEHAIAIGNELGAKEERMHALRTLADVSRAQGDPIRALTYFEAYIALKDSLDGDAQQARVAELTAKYESEKKDKELAESRSKELALHEDARLQRSQKTIYLISAILLAAFAVLLIGRVRLKRRMVGKLEAHNAEVLRQKDRAEESERAKSRFLANVSHEIRTPLNAILGFTDLLLHEPQDERTNRFLSNIRDAGDDLLVVINDVLDLSRMEAGRLTLIDEPFDLYRCVHLCEAILHHRAVEQQDQLNVHIDADVPQWVVGDSARLTQILLNLLGNALKFTTHGEVRLMVSNTAADIRFRISDTGIGIPKDKLTSVFDRFVQVDQKDQRRYGGTGLGLSIVKELVALYKGRIHVESEPGKGTAFTVVLALEAVEAPATTGQGVHANRNNVSLDGRTILVAEDNDLNAVVTTETLKRHYPGTRIVRVDNGRAAVERIAQDTEQDIALVLMDVQMPELDGLAATRQVRAMKNASARVPIVALTASVLPTDLSRCIDAGMDACVTKPFKVAELLKAMERLTGDGGSAPVHDRAIPDLYVELFHTLVPQRLSAMRQALARNDHAEVRRIVHVLRPQLVHRDAARFSEACDAVLDTDRSGDALWLGKVERMIGEIEREIA